MSDRDWRQDAACNDMAPQFDLDYWDADKDNHPLKLLPVARICHSCPVRNDCEQWADSEVAAGNDVDWIAAGFVYRRAKAGGATKTEITWRVCEADDCANVIATRTARFCCTGCRTRARAA